MSRPTHQALIDRENAISARERSIAGTDDDVLAAINYDRRARWALLVATMTVPPPLAAWVAEMTAQYGPTVRIWRNEVDWLTALLVARYGEAEYHWPESFGDDDVIRARRWRGGAIPEGVAYLVAQES